MKRLVNTVIFVFVVAATTWAQEGHHDQWRNLTPEQKADKMTERMAEKLALTGGQKERVKSIHLKYAEQFEALRVKEMTHEDRHKEMRPLKKAMADEFKEVLNEEQWAKFEAHHHEKRAKRHHQRCEKHHEKYCCPKDSEKN